MKKIFAILAVLALLGAFLPASASEDGEGAATVPREELVPKGEYIAGNTPLSGFDPSKERLTRMWRSDISATFFGGTHYIRGNLPKGFTANSIIESCSMVMRLDGPDRRLERPTKYALEFVSGEPALKNVFSFEIQGNGDETRLRLVLDSAKTAVTPGEATFRFTLENDRYFLQEERTLRVVRFEEEPLVYSPDVPVVIRMQEGDTFFIDGDVDNENPENLTFIAASRFLTPPNGSNVLLDVRSFEKLNGKKPFSKIKGIQLDTDAEKWHFAFTRSGSYDVKIPLFYGDIHFNMPVRFCVAEDSITGPETLLPGEETDFTVKGSDLAYTWSLKGEGAAIDAKTGHLTVKENAEPGSRLMITAKPKKKGTVLSVNLTIGAAETEKAP